MNGFIATPQEGRPRALPARAPNPWPRRLVPPDKHLDIGPCSAGAYRR